MVVGKFLLTIIIFLYSEKFHRLYCTGLGLIFFPRNILQFRTVPSTFFLSSFSFPKIGSFVTSYFTTSPMVTVTQHNPFLPRKNNNIIILDWYSTCTLLSDFPSGLYLLYWAKNEDTKGVIRNHRSASSRKQQQQQGFPRARELPFYGKRRCYYGRWPRGFLCAT